MINAQDIKNGTCIRMDGKLYFCIEFLHVKPGKGNTFMRTKLKDVVSGYVLERRFNIGEKLEDVRVERRPYQFLYKEGEDYIFMNQETFDQHPIAHDLINGVDFLLEGAVLDVAVDIRKGSPTFGQYVSVELTGENHRQFFIPRGFAHGFSVLSEEVIFQYKCDNFYSPQSEGAIAWNDPDLNIDWRIPAEKVVLSEKDS